MMATLGLFVIVLAFVQCPSVCRAHPVNNDDVVQDPASGISTELETIEYSLLDNDTATIMVCTSSPCQNGGSCVETAPSTYKCHCPPYYLGDHCGMESTSNVALSTCGTTCSTSSQLTPEENCMASLDGSSVIEDPKWASNYERVGAWFRIQFTAYFRIKEFQVFDRWNHDRSSDLLRLTTRGHKDVLVELMCIGDYDDDKFWQMFDLEPTITDYLQIEVMGTCDPGSDDYVGFRSVAVYGNDVPLVKITSTAYGSTCTASSTYHETDFPCEKAFDGLESALSSEWVTNGQGVGAWIQVNFVNEETVVGVGFLQRCGQNTQVDFMSVSFSDASTQQVGLVCFSGQDLTDCDGQYWQQFDLNPHVVTTYVRMTISGVCTSGNNGFREIRVFSLREESRY